MPPSLTPGTADIIAQGKPAPVKMAGHNRVLLRLPLRQRPLLPVGAEVIAGTIQEDPVPVQKAAQRRNVLHIQIQGVPELAFLREDVGPAAALVLVEGALTGDRFPVLVPAEQVQQHQENVLFLIGIPHPSRKFRLKEPPQPPIPDGPDGLPVTVVKALIFRVALLPPEQGVGLGEVPLLLVQEGQLGGVPDLFLCRLLGQVVPEVVRLRRLGVRQEFPVHPEGAAQDAF